MGAKQILFNEFLLHSLCVCVCVSYLKIFSEIRKFMYFLIQSNSSNGFSTTQTAEKETKKKEITCISMPLFLQRLWLLFICLFGLVFKNKSLSSILLLTVFIFMLVFFSSSLFFEIFIYHFAKHEMACGSHVC